MAMQPTNPENIGEQETRMDFTTIPNSQLDTYISYYELAPSFPPPLDPLPSTGDDDNGEEQAELEDYLYSTGPNGNGVSSSSSYTSQRKRGIGEISGGGNGSGGSDSRTLGKTRAERERSRRREREKEAAYEEAQLAKQREREARERENMGLPPEQPLGRRAAAAAASTRMRGDIIDPFGDRDGNANEQGASGTGAGGYGEANGTQPYGGGYPGAGQNGLALNAGLGGAMPGRGSVAGPLPGDDPPCPDSFFDGEAANNYLSAVSREHFLSLPHPKEGEIVVGFLYKCRTEDKILKIA